VLPHIKHSYHYRYTPRLRENNRSLPKIPEPYPEYIQPNVVRSKNQSQEKVQLKDRIKSKYQIKKQQPSPVFLADATFASNDL
jgi:hypothetical protein